MRNKHIKNIIYKTIKKTNELAQLMLFLYIVLSRFVDLGIINIWARHFFAMGTVGYSAVLLASTH